MKGGEKKHSWIKQNVSNQKQKEKFSSFLIWGIQARAKIWQRGEETWAIFTDEGGLKTVWLEYSKEDSCGIAGVGRASTHRRR